MILKVVADSGEERSLKVTNDVMYLIRSALISKRDSLLSYCDGEFVDKVVDLSNVIFFLTECLNGKNGSSALSSFQS